jgi:hypothetical protein
VYSITVGEKMRRTLDEQLAARWRINTRGGLPARLGRWRSLPALLLQRMGLHVWTSARLFYGPSMQVLAGEATSAGLLAFGYVELALTSFMLRHVKPGMTVVDIGAHFGYETLLASQLSGRAAK